MTRFRELVENILNESEFNSGDIVMLKLNNSKVGTINKILGEKFGRLYYDVAFPSVEKNIGKINVNVTDDKGIFYKLSEKYEPIPEDQLILATKEQLDKAKQELILKYNIKSNEELERYGYFK